MPTQSGLLLPGDAAFREAVLTEAGRRGYQRYETDRQDRPQVAFNPEGKPYEVCPMCSVKASVRTVLVDDTTWHCEWCGYRDSDKLGPLN